MNLQNFMHEPFFLYWIMPLFIFLARIVDVTIGTLRIVFVAKGHKLLAPLLGFFEVFVWVLVIGQIMNHPYSFFYYVAYAGGFATGNYVGLLIEERIAVGTQLVRVVTKQSGNTLIKNLNEAGFGATLIVAEGGKGKVDIIYSIVQRHSLKKVLRIIQAFSPNAFYTIEDIRGLSAGIFPARERFRMSKASLKDKEAARFLKRWRSGK